MSNKIIYTVLAFVLAAYWYWIYIVIKGQS